MFLGKEIEIKILTNFSSLYLCLQEVSPALRQYKQRDGWKRDLKKGWVKNLPLSWGFPSAQHYVGIDYLLSSSGIAVVGLLLHTCTDASLSPWQQVEEHPSTSHKRILAPLDFVETSLKVEGQYFWKIISNSDWFWQVKLVQYWDIGTMDILGGA